MFIKMPGQVTGTQKDANQLSSLFYFISAPSALENVSTMCFLNFTCHLSSLKWVDNILPIKKFFCFNGRINGLQRSLAVCLLILKCVGNIIIVVIISRIFDSQECQIKNCQDVASVVWKD